MKWNIERNENKITLDYESYLKNISEKVIKKLAVKSIYRISEIFKVSIKQIILDKHLIYVILNDPGKNGYLLMMSTEIMGLSHREREEVANIVLYNTQ